MFIPTSYYADDPLIRRLISPKVSLNNDRTIRWITWWYEKLYFQQMYQQKPNSQTWYFPGSSVSIAHLNHLFHILQTKRWITCGIIWFAHKSQITSGKPTVAPKKLSRDSHIKGMREWLILTFGPFDLLFKIGLPKYSKKKYQNWIPVESTHLVICFLPIFRRHVFFA